MSPLIGLLIQISRKNQPISLIIKQYSLVSNIVLRLLSEDLYC